MLEHGGELINAARRYGTPAQGWLDLSTGINPHAWPGTPSPRSWYRLPEEQDGLVAAACDYYGAAHVLPVPGTQAAIQTLPRLRERCDVAVVEPSYAEHAHRWRIAGHRVIAVRGAELLAAANTFDVLVICNPNNPSGERYAPALLLEVHARLAARGGWLVVDEAFIDATPEESLAGQSGHEGLIVLRSFGKFFGLAGARIGFVLAAAALLDSLNEWIGPWAVNGPARSLACEALRDRRWHSTMRVQLQLDSARLAALLQSRGLAPAGGCPLFQWIASSQADAIHQALAQQSILARRFSSPASLRFGLPGNETDWDRLDAALANLRVVEPVNTKAA